MPLDLPGLYWDESKNRYFSSSAKPISPPQFHSSAPVSAPSKQNPNRSLWNASEHLRTTCFRSHRESAAQLASLSSLDRTASILSSSAVMCAQVASTSMGHRSHIPVNNGSITSFGTSTTDGCRRSFIGDDQGWIYSHTPDIDPPEDAPPQLHWFPDFTLHASCEISTICVTNSLCVATSGPARKFLVRHLGAQDRGTLFIFDLRRQADEIWTSHLQDRTLVLGINMKAAYIQDLERPLQLRSLNTQSDVFAVHQHQNNLVFTGSRNGSIHRFDTRVDEPHGQKLFDGRLRNQKLSVRYLTAIRDWQLVASHSNGDLAMFDLRFPRCSHPQMVFTGHVDSVCAQTPRLGIAIDPSEDFLFAAGQDGRIRAWSLRTGAPLLSPHTPRSTERKWSNPLTTVLDHPAVALQFTTERAGLCLWAASGVHLYRFDLGQRNHESTMT